MKLVLRQTAARGFRTCDLLHVAQALIPGCDTFWSFDEKANALAPPPSSIQFAQFEQQAALIHGVGIVHAEQMHRRAPDFRPAGDVRTIAAEMILPTVLPGMEKSRQAPGRGIQRRNVRTFDQITPRARQSEIAILIRATVLRGDDVLNMERRQRLMLLAQTAILAPVPGAAANIPAQALLHD